MVQITFHLTGGGEDLSLDPHSLHEGPAHTAWHPACRFQPPQADPEDPRTGWLAR